MENLALLKKTTSLFKTEHSSLLNDSLPWCPLCSGQCRCLLWTLTRMADFEPVSSDSRVITNLEALPSYGERELSESGQIWANWILETTSQVS